MARPSKLTPEVRDAVCRFLRAGNPFRVACEAAGVAAKTGMEWRARGEDRDPDRPGDEAFADFADATRRAEAEALARCAAVVQKAVIDGSFQAASWFLERRAPAEWGKVDRHQVTGPDGGPIEIAPAISVEQLRARVLAIGKELGLIPPVAGVEEGPGMTPGATEPCRTTPCLGLANQAAPQLDESSIEQSCDPVNGGDVIDVEVREIEQS